MPHTRAAHHSGRITPAAEINTQFANFALAFANVLEYYVASIENGSTSTITVSATLTQPYIYPSTQMQVDNAAVFGPNGSFTTPMIASALKGGVPLNASYVLTGRSGNTLIVDTTNSTNSNLDSGDTLAASIQSTSQTSAAAIFPSYIASSTQQLAISLVSYFNSLPLKLPYFNAPPHTANQRGAIQKYVYQQVAGNGLSSPSLEQMLLAITLPTTTGPDLQIYNQTVASAIEQSRQQLLTGIGQVYAGHLRISAPAPNNPLGTLLNISTTGSGASGGTSSGGSTGTIA